MIHIDSNQGCIGEFWWINSDQSTLLRVSTTFAGAHIHLDLVQWGSCGFGRDIKIAMEGVPIDD
jgi:hypothetical protein